MIILIVVNWLKVIYEIGHQKVIVLLVYIEFGGDGCYKSCPKQIWTGGPLNSGNAKKERVFSSGIPSLTYRTSSSSESEVNIFGIFDPKLKAPLHLHISKAHVSQEMVGHETG